MRMRSWIKDFCCFGVITIVVCVYFLRLFYPNVQLIMTPDFRRSDAWSFSFTTKYILSSYLKNNQLPWIVDTLGNGFPLIAEGQVGAFFVPNLILFKFFDPAIAYNLALIFSVLFIGWGTYVWFRVEKISRFASLFGGITACFSGIVIPHLTHIALLQAFSLLPWIMACVTRIGTKPTKWAFICFSLLSSQQIFAGFPQAVFITHCFALSYIIFLFFQNTQFNLKYITLLLASYMSIIGLSAIQLVPSAEFLRQTVYPSGMPIELASLYSFPLKQFATYLYPFLLGRPFDGSYQAHVAADASIFWENNGYIGVLPLIFILVAGVFVIKNLAFSPKIKLLLTGLISSLLLMLGKYSPLYFFYSIWPLNLFRVPSRFIWVFTYMLLILGMYSFSWIIGNIKNVFFRMCLVLCVFVIQITSLIYVWEPYHMYVDAKEWTAKPLFAGQIPKKSGIYSIETDHAYFDEFTKGWKDQRPYKFLQNALPANGNALWDIRHYDVATGRDLRRSSIIGSMILEDIHADSSVASVSALATKLFQLNDIGYIISAKEMPQSAFTEISTIHNKDTKQKLFLYKTLTPVPVAYIARNLFYAQTAETAKQTFSSEYFIPGQSALLESDGDTLQEYQQFPTITIQNNTPTELRVNVSQTNAPMYLISTHAYYPGWHVLIDGKEQTMLPANVTQQAVLLPKGAGERTVTFIYSPSSIRIGVIITFLSVLIVLCLMVFLPSAFFFYIHQKKSSRPLHPEDSHDR